MTLEVLRSFESPRVAPTTRIVASSTKVVAQTSTLTWGAAGVLPIAVADIKAGSASIKVDAASVNKEAYRTTESVRIENPDNSSDFVMVDRIKTIGFKKTKAETIQSSTVDKTTGVTTTTSGTLPTTSDYELTNV